MSFTVNGEINTTLACVPQVGVIIWGCELGVLQVWLGFMSKAVFEMSGGGGTGGSQGFTGKGSIDLRAFGELVAFLLGSRYSIFYIEFPLFKGDWKIGEEASGSGGDAVRAVPPFVRLTADAFANIVKGKVSFNTASKTAGYTGGEEATLDSALIPYAGCLIALEVYDKDFKIKYSKGLETDQEGSFSFQFPTGTNILPSDYVCVNVQDHMSPEFLVENNKYKVAGTSPKIKATVPFSEVDINLDAFNDVITGMVSGDYTGYVDIMIFDGTANKTIRVAAVKGLIRVDYPIDESTLWAYPQISFEDSTFPSFAPLRYPNLDALTINIFNDFSQQVRVATGNGIKDSMTIPGLIDKGFNLPDSVTNAKIPGNFTNTQKNLESEDIEGNKFITPTRITGTITNKADMGWLESHGDEYVRPGNTNGATKLKHFDGEVRITEIEVQSALEAMLEDSKDPHDNWLPPILGETPEPLYTSTVQAQQAIELIVVKDKSQPAGVRIEQKPTSSDEFVFNNPDVCAYKIEIEYEGRKLEKIYNPYSYHYNNNQQSLSDFIGPLREAVTLVSEKREASVVNPADVMNQWNASWVPQIGVMSLTQKGSAVIGSIMQDGTALTVEVTVKDGVFKGSVMVPSTTSIFADIVTIEMAISTDGKSIDFRNVSGSGLKSLKGTKATKKMQ